MWIWSLRIGYMYRRRQSGDSSPLKAKGLPGLSDAAGECPIDNCLAL